MIVERIGDRHLARLPWRRLDSRPGILVALRQELLLELVDTQLFRIKFIDPKFPGHKGNPEKLMIASKAVKTLREVFNQAKGFKNRDAA